MKSFAVVALILMSGFAYAQIPQTISYQGVLTDASGEPVTAAGVKLTFRIHTNPNNSAVLWQEVHDNVPVENGVFNVILGSQTPLDLPFDSPYFLGITVGDGTELMPLIELTSSPYSLKARSVADTSVTGQKIADGVVVRSLRILAADGSSVATLTDDVKLRAGNNVSLDVDGFTGEVLISAAGGGAGAGDGHSLDAADGSPVDALFVDNSGNVGIGTSNPQRTLHIRKDINNIVGLTIDNRNTEQFSTERISFVNEDGDVAGIQLSDDDSFLGPRMLILNNRPGGRIVFATGGFDRMTLSNAGNLGIGTSSPTEKLHLNTPSGTDMRIFFSEGGNPAASLFYQGSAGTGMNNLLHLRSEISGSEANIMTWKLNGNVGIGTTSPAQKLSVNGTIESQSGGFKFPDGTVQATAAGGGSGDGHSLDAADGSPANVVFVNNSGDVGVGTTTPSSKFHIVDTANMPADPTLTSNVAFKVTNGTSRALLFDDNQVESVGGALHLNARATGGTGNDIIMANGGGNVGIGTSNPAAKLDVSGDVSTAGNIKVSGEVRRTSTGNANMLPICYGVVQTNGSIDAGSGNFSVQKDNQFPGWYYITITGENFSEKNYIVSITPTSSSIIGVYSSDTGRLWVETRGIGGIRVDSGFSFVVYKP